MIYISSVRKIVEMIERIEYLRYLIKEKPVDINDEDRSDIEFYLGKLVRLMNEARVYIGSD